MAERGEITFESDLAGYQFYIDELNRPEQKYDGFMSVVNTVYLAHDHALRAQASIPPSVSNTIETHLRLRTAYQLGLNALIRKVQQADSNEVVFVGTFAKAIAEHTLEIVKLQSRRPLRNKLQDRSRM